MVDTYSPPLLFKGTFDEDTNGLVPFRKPDGQTVNLIPIGDKNWKRILIEVDITAITGTNVTAKLKTCINPASPNAIANTTMDAKDGAGNAVASSALTAIGRTLIAVSRNDADNGSSNIGPYIGLWLTESSITDLAGTVSVYVD